MRNNLYKISTAILALALIFTLSCSDDKDEGGGGVIHGTSVTYEGETYQTVVIGTQTWMAQNLNYNVSGSKCNSDEEINCATYGRLYDWATAMALPSQCNSNTCSWRINAKHMGICPKGWHLPSNEEWYVLEKFVSPRCYLEKVYEVCEDAGTKLKATSGWKDVGWIEGKSGNGTDEYGFAALPGGSGDTYGVGDFGRWWSSSERGDMVAYGISVSSDEGNMEVSVNNIHGIGFKKSEMISVRCLKD